MSIEPEKDDQLKISKDGLNRVKAWEHAVQKHLQAKLALTEAHANLIAAEQALATWMLPHDFQTGEKICVWVGDTLIQVEALSDRLSGNHAITIRNRKPQTK